MSFVHRFLIASCCGGVLAVISSSSRCLSHCPADLESQGECLLVLGNTHEAAEELHVERSLQVVPKERCLGHTEHGSCGCLT